MWMIGSPLYEGRVNCSAANILTPPPGKSQISPAVVSVVRRGTRFESADILGKRPTRMVPVPGSAAGALFDAQINPYISAVFASFCHKAFPPIKNMFYVYGTGAAALFYSRAMLLIDNLPAMQMSCRSNIQPLAAPAQCPSSTTTVYRPGATPEKIRGYNRCFEGSLCIVPRRENRLIPDFYHIVLHILIALNIVLLCLGL